MGVIALKHWQTREDLDIGIALKEEEVQLVGNVRGGQSQIFALCGNQPCFKIVKRDETDEERDARH